MSSKQSLTKSKRQTRKEEHEKSQNLNLAHFRVFKKTVTIQLPNFNNSALDNISLRTALLLQPLFIKFPLVANKTTKRALIPLFFRSTSPKK
jgi:hypothetical protein